MAGLLLKEYQRESLESIQAFCCSVQEARSNRASCPVRDAFYRQTARKFIDVPQLPGIPYFCLRIPTGGGKTLVAAHAVGAIARHLSRQERPICLWVTPNTTIREQTISGLRDREHPLNMALRDGLGGQPVEVLTMDEALSASRGRIAGSATVIVVTIQSYRIRNDRGEVEETSRKVYEDNGSLMDHFSNLDPEQRAVVSDPVTGGISWSFANVLKLRRPIVVMDEAHNARTPTSFDSLARFGPIAVLEITATPQLEHDPANGLYGSNVLYAASALQLKNEGMIKLPVELESRDNWLDVLTATVQRRNSLAKLAASFELESGRFIRPIALVQAQPKSRTRETQTAERVKQALIEQLNVPAERVRICTGSVDELVGEDLKSGSCLVEYIVTVDKLREGWDCPFAYVLGSVGNVATETAVEQLLGRVLRMPEAVPTGVPELDRAYAIVQSEDVAVTAKNLADSLVDSCGFDKATVGDVLRVRRQHDSQLDLPLSSILVTSVPTLSGLPPELRSRLHLQPDTRTIQVHGTLSRNEAVSLRNLMSAPEDRKAVERFWQDTREVGTALQALDDEPLPMTLPQLAVRDGQKWLRFEPVELDEFSWDLDRCDATVSETDFSATVHVGDRVTLDVSGIGSVRVGSVEQVLVDRPSILPADDNWEPGALVRWLDRELRRGGKNAGITASETQAWLNRVLDYLVRERGIAVSALDRKKHELADIVVSRIEEHGQRQVRRAAEMLFAGETGRRLETTYEMPFSLTSGKYGPYQRYEGSYNFRKHAFELIGELGNEEADCAKKIDDHPNVKRWVRNLVHESAGGFSLPLSPGRFFPDFIVELNDGKVGAVEYKGSHLADSRREKHKETVGKLWAARSGGKCVFVWIVDNDWSTLHAALSACGDAMGS